MSSDSDNDEMYTEPEFYQEETKVTPINLLPEKSKKKYESVYKAFMDWQSPKNIDSFSENVLLEYFRELSEKYKSPSLWVQYSMLRSTLDINHGVNIEKYTRLRSFLKRNSEGYVAKKVRTFTSDDIDRFINEAPDDTYLAMKVALIMGVTGGCRATELHSMNIDDVRDLGSAMLVTVPDSKTKIIRKFTVTDHFYDICKKYVNLRPRNIETNAFFLNYQHGKCSTLNIGINKFGTMGKQIAQYLKLPNPELYTGHVFRKSSTASGSITTLKIQDHTTSTANQVFQTVKEEALTEDINIDLSSTPSVHFTNCSNITINFICRKEDK